MRFPVKVVAAGVLATLASGCASAAPPAQADVAPAARAIENGPASDYPVEVGAPYRVGEVVYTPLDTMNFDEVGFADADTGGGVTAAHHTLPIPSYVEVTALDSGVTALVRVERRGPMDGTAAIALSPAAREQLGIGDGAPVRVRRVNPPEDDRALLRASRAAPLRMTTPAGLLAVLKRRLPTAGAASLADPRQAAVSGRVPDAGTMAAIAAPPPVPAKAPAPAASAAPVPPSVPAPVPTPAATAAPRPAAAAAKGRYLIQIGAFAVAGNAEALARKLGARVVRAGTLSLVQAGPFADRGQAEQALAKLRGQGYSDARIRTSD